MFGSEIVEILQKAGLILKHMLGVVLLAWRRMARAGLISWGVGFILVELVGSLIAHQFSGPALALTSVVALIFASMVAYSVMLTVLIEELFLGTIDTVRVLEGDIEGGARALAVASERKAGEAGSGIMRWLGHAPNNRGAKVGAVTYTPISETQADIQLGPFTYPGELGAIDPNLEGPSLLGLPFFSGRLSFLGFDFQGRELIVIP